MLAGFKGEEVLFADPESKAQEEEAVCALLESNWSSRMDGWYSVETTQAGKLCWEGRRRWWESIKDDDKKSLLADG